MDLHLIQFDTSNYYLSFCYKKKKKEKKNKVLFIVWLKHLVSSYVPLTTSDDSKVKIHIFNNLIMLIFGASVIHA